MNEGDAVIRLEILTYMKEFREIMKDIDDMGIWYRLISNTHHLRNIMMMVKE